MDIKLRRKLLVFYDEDSGYTERLSHYLGQRKDCIFEVRGFSDKEALVRFARENPVDVLLIPREALTEELGRQSDLIFILSDEPGEQDGEYRTICKYRSSEQLMREITAAYEAKKLSRIGAGLRDMKADAIGIYSPVGRCYKSTFALLLAQLLAEQAPTLLVNLEDYPAYHTLTSAAEPDGGDEGKEDLSDILYYRRVGGEAEPRRIFGAVQFADRLAYLPPVSCPMDIRMAGAKDLAAVLTCLGGSELYRYLVIDLGNALADPLPVLALCRRIYVPSRRDSVSEAKVRAFEDYLSGIGEDEILARLRKVTLPTYSRIAEDGFDARALRSSPFGRYLEKNLEAL